MASPVGAGGSLWPQKGCDTDDEDDPVVGLSMSEELFSFDDDDEEEEPPNRFLGSPKSPKSPNTKKPPISSLVQPETKNSTPTPKSVTTADTTSKDPLPKVSTGGTTRPKDKGGQGIGGWLGQNLRSVRKKQLAATLAGEAAKANSKASNQRVSSQATKSTAMEPQEQADSTSKEEKCVAGEDGKNEGKPAKGERMGWQEGGGVIEVLGVKYDRDMLRIVQGIGGLEPEARRRLREMAKTSEVRRNTLGYIEKMYGVVGDIPKPKPPRSPTKANTNTADTKRRTSVIMQKPPQTQAKVEQATHSKPPEPMGNMKKPTKIHARHDKKNATTTNKTAEKQSASKEINPTLWGDSASYARSNHILDLARRTLINSRAEKAAMQVFKDEPTLLPPPTIKRAAGRPLGLVAASDSDHKHFSKPRSLLEDRETGGLPTSGEVIDFLLRDVRKATAEVDLSGSSLCDSGLIAFAFRTAQPRLASLASLKLSNNQLTGQSLRPLTTSIKHLPALKHLSLSNNRLGIGAPPDGLGAFLRSAERLEFLDLAHNQIGSSASDSLSALLRSTQTLRVLRLEGNPLSLRVLWGLADGLSVNRSLHELTIHPRWDATRALANLKQLLKRNRAGAGTGGAGEEAARAHALVAAESKINSQAERIKVLLMQLERADEEGEVLMGEVRVEKAKVLRLEGKLRRTERELTEIKSSIEDQRVDWERKRAEEKSKWVEERGEVMREATKLRERLQTEREEVGRLKESLLAEARRSAASVRGYEARIATYEEGLGRRRGADEEVYHSFDRRLRKAREMREDTFWKKRVVLGDTPTIPKVDETAGVESEEVKTSNDDNDLLIDHEAGLY